MTELAISARNITVVFKDLATGARRRKGADNGGVKALTDVSFDVRAGEAFGIVGSNGAGKSTLMRVIGQTLIPDSGDLTVRGATSTLLQLGVGFNPQLDGSRNIYLGCLAAGMPKKRVDELHDGIWEYSELGPALYRPLHTYSRGMQSRLAFAIATFLDADILLVDEVLAVGDAAFKQKSLRTMHELLERSGTIVMVSHALSTVQEFCDRVMWLDHGETQQIGDPAAVIMAYRSKYTLGDKQLLRESRSESDVASRPADVRVPEPLDIEAMRTARAGSPPLAYRDFAPPVPAGRAAKRARKLIDIGWKRGRGDIVSLQPPIAWTGGSPEGAAALNSWEPVGILLAAYAQTPDRGWLQAAAAIAVDWVAYHPLPDDDPAWAAGVTGLRSHRLGSLIDHLAADPLASDAALKSLTAAAQVHAAHLASEPRLPLTDLTGLYDIVGLIDLAKRVPEIPDADQLGLLGEARFDGFLDASFAKDGVHLEHTPSYHAAVVETLTHLLEIGAVAGTKPVRVRNKAEKALAWFVVPDGSIAGFGDTEPVAVSDWLTGSDKPSLGGIKRRWHTGPMRGAASAGKAGRLPIERVKAFDRGGYVVLRSQWPDRPAQPDASYLAMMAGRHSTRRKHADDLSVIWYDVGRPLLVDAGSYERPAEGEPAPDDKYRQYVTSAGAHNGVEIDGARHYPGEPFGSGATHAGEIDERRYGAAKATFGRLVYRRLALLDPGKWLLLVDLLLDRSETAHTYRSWLHFAPDLEVAADGDAFSVTGDGVDLQVRSLSGATPIGPLRGQLDPQPQGWHAPRDGVIEPVWGVGFQAAEGPRAMFATVLSLVGAVRPVSTESGRGINQAHLVFEVGGEMVDAAIDLRNERPLTLAPQSQRP
jgi:ABC-type polysaccharide/polyol phosphate transport system ATPase subunit